MKYSPCGNREGLDYNGNCVECTDPNCRDCSDIWNTCKKCDDRFSVDDQGQCNPLVG